MVEKLGKQGFHYEIKEFFEPITEAVTDSCQKLLEETNSNTKAVEQLDESNVQIEVSELINKNSVFRSSLIRPIANYQFQFKKVNSENMMILIVIFGMII